MIRKENRLDFSSSFSNVGRRSQFGTYLLALCIEGLILLAGIAAAGILAVILGSIGYGISKLASYENYRLLVLLFSAPAGLILALYVLVNALIFSPTAYIIANNEGVSAGETIGACYKSMINNGKFTVFFSYFVSNLLKTLYLGAFGFGGYILMRFVPENYFLLALIGWVIISLAGYLTFAPILTLTNRVVKEHLFEDIVLDPAVATRINEKVNLSVCKGKTLKTEVSKNLASLFEYTEDPYRILEVTDRKSKQIGAKRLKVKKKPPQNAAARKREMQRKRYVSKATEATQPATAPEPEEPSNDAGKTAAVEIQPEVTPAVEAQPETPPVVEAGETVTANQPLN